MKKIGLFIIVGLLAACTYDATDHSLFPFKSAFPNYKIYPYTLKRTFAETKHIAEKNYKVGDHMISRVGTPIINAKAYSVDYFYTKEVVASDVTDVKGKLIRKEFGPRTPLRVIGVINLDGTDYKLVPLTNDFTLLVDDNGNISHKVVNVNGTKYTPTNDYLDIHPKDAKINNVTYNKISRRPDSLDIMVRYDGVKDGKFYLSFMSYIPNTDRQHGSFKTEGYDINTTRLEFAGFTIRVLNASANQMDYFVIKEPASLKDN